MARKMRSSSAKLVGENQIGQNEIDGRGRKQLSGLDQGYRLNEYAGITRFGEYPAHQFGMSRIVFEKKDSGLKRGAFHRFIPTPGSFLRGSSARSFEPDFWFPYHPAISGRWFHCIQNDLVSSINSTNWLKSNGLTR